MTTRLRVLVIEDSQDVADLVILELQRSGYDVVSQHAGTREAMLAALDQEPWDVVFSNNSPLSFDALQATRLLRQVDRDLPFIVISSMKSEDQADDWMRAGANDYVLKSDLERLPSVVEREIASQPPHPRAESCALRLAVFAHSPKPHRWPRPERSHYKLEPVCRATL